ncbi:MAG: YqeG family HAD IIIA-type phosphatase [Bacilli bacterium]|jgi:HAD superfamily phosphatase (TIGR01668 family)|nr:YqeG family HAD IIIA-type phosphatase [Bacilli bacterium]MCX4254329.1 YqeG family HAD IIIA-type phosphatase [Bacilli bacterium]
MENFIPDIYQKNIYDIDYHKLKKRGIKCLLFDLDNTLVPVKTDTPTKKVKELFHFLETDFKVIIISNSNRKRLIPFKEGLNVDVAASAHKPFKKKYLKIMATYKFKEHEIAAIGDQLLTDIYGANKIGITSILISPIGEYEKFGTKINRFFEKFLYRRLKRKNILIKGEFYD